jgi:uncharacterized protein (TIGR02001 family)
LILRLGALPESISAPVAALIGLLLAGLATPAALHAQVGGSVVFESDDRFRGVSINHEQADLRLSLSYDHLSGAFCGVSAAVDPSTARSTNRLSYAGFGAPAGAALHWDVGLTQAQSNGESRRNYAEVFAGLFADRWALRAFFSPDYYGGGLKTLYAEADLNWPLTEAGRVVAHLGSLRSLDGGSAQRLDTRLGAVVRIADFSLQLAWTDTAGQGRLALPRGQHRQAVVVSSSWEF